jgi:hypothetical protein
MVLVDGNLIERSNFFKTSGFTFKVFRVVEYDLGSPKRTILARFEVIFFEKVVF